MKKRKLRKRLVAVLGASVLLGSNLLVGCNGKNNDDQYKEGSKQAEITASNLDEIDISEKIKIKIMVQSNLDLDNLPMFQELEKKCNVDIIWDAVESGYSEKKAVTIASNDLPDIFFAGVTAEDIVTNPESFLDMTPYLDLAPNVKQMFEEKPITKYVSTYGKDEILSLPQVTGFNPRSHEVMMINKSWLDKLGLDIPTTFDELEVVLKAFKDGDPNGNGKDDEIPMDWPCEYGHGPFCLVGSYGVVDNKDKVMVQNGEVGFLYENEAYKGVVEYLGKLYAQGLINQEVFTTTDYSVANALSSEGEDPRVGLTFGWSLESRMGKFADEYIVLPQIKANDSIEKVLWPRDPDNKVNTKVACTMTKSCSNPERAMMLINELYSEDFALQEYYGSAPEFVEKQEDGSWIIKEPAEGETIESQKAENALVNRGPCYVSNDLETKTKLPQELQSRLDQDEVYKDTWPAENLVYPSVKYTDEEVEELTYIKTDIDKYVDQQTADWVVNGGVESGWDEFQKQLKKMDLDRLKELYQAAYDRAQEGMNE